MLLLVLALVWLAILLPIVLRYWRDRGGERKIDSYHVERETLIRQEQAAVSETRREVPASEPLERERPSRPHLTVVYPEDTVHSLQARGSWDEWRRDYDYEMDEHRDATRARLESNRYAAAYASVPQNDFEVLDDERYEPLVNMRVRRRRVLVTLVLACLVFTVLTLASSSRMIEDLAVLSWAALIGFVVLGLVAIGLGYMASPLDVAFDASSRTGELVPAPDDDVYEVEDDLLDEEFYYEREQRAWRHDAPARRALG